MANPDIRPVPDAPSGAAAGADPVGGDSSGEPRGSRRWPLIALGAALLIALVLLLWSRSQLGSEIDALRRTVAEVEETNALLREQLSRREALIDAQTRRLGEVRDGVLGLIGLIDQPIEPGEPAP